jgi:hypothetical protein
MFLRVLCALGGASLFVVGLSAIQPEVILPVPPFPPIQPISPIQPVP